MDAQTTVADTAALAALVQCLARLECEEGFACDQLLTAPEVLDENRFVAARDGVEAKLIEPRLGRAVPVRELVERAVEACRPHARALRCEAGLEDVIRLTEQPPAARQVAHARDPERLPGLVRELAEGFTAPGPGY